MILQNDTQRHNRHAMVVVMAAICMVLLVAMLALTLDGGLLYDTRRHGQATADATALAAASEIYDNYWTDSGADDSGSAKSCALATANANGYANDNVISNVEVSIPPKTGDYAGKRGYVEVVTEFKQGRNFSNIFGYGSLPVRARAVALGSPVAADVGILVLDPTARSAFNAQGGGLTVVDGTPVVVNSNHAEAAIAGGGGSVQADKFVIRGGYDTSGGGTFIGPIYTGRPPMADPLIDLPTPDPTSLTLQRTRKVQETSGTVNLQPGVYRGGISVSGTGSLSLAPGIYYMDGGGFSFSGQGSLFGEGVMIYNSPGNGNSNGISVSGQGSMVISAPTSGIYQGVTFFQRRDANVTGNVQGTGGDTKITGTFYFSGALLNISGNGGVSNMGSQYISRLLNLGGNGGINIDWKPDQVARKRSIFLVE